MGYFQWTDELTTHIEEVDIQHKEFISLINDLYDALKKGKEDSILGEILSNLIEYAIIHFATEERLMKKHDYYDLGKHKQEHDEFKNHIGDLNKRHNNFHNVSAGAVIKFIKDWLTNHIKVTDMKFASFLKSQGIH